MKPPQRAKLFDFSQLRAFKFSKYFEVCKTDSAMNINYKQITVGNILPISPQVTQETLHFATHIFNCSAQ
jgi:hypothetical protein